MLHGYNPVHEPNPGHCQPRALLLHGTGVHATCTCTFSYGAQSAEHCASQWIVHYGGANKGRIELVASFNGLYV